MTLCGILTSQRDCSRQKVSELHLEMHGYHLLYSPTELFQTSSAYSLWRAISQLSNNVVPPRKSDTEVRHGSPT